MAVVLLNTAGLQLQTGLSIEIRGTFDSRVTELNGENVSHGGQYRIPDANPEPPNYEALNHYTLLFFSTSFVAQPGVRSLPLTGPRVK
jgi:hypothetical protein